MQCDASELSTVDRRRMHARGRRQLIGDGDQSVEAMLSSDVEVSHGNSIRVAGFGAIGADSGIFKADGTFRGHAGEDDPAEDAAVCRLLEG